MHVTEPRAGPDGVRVVVRVVRTVPPVDVAAEPAGAPGGRPVVRLAPGARALELVQLRRRETLRLRIQLQ